PIANLLNLLFLINSNLIWSRFVIRVAVISSTGAEFGRKTLMMWLTIFSHLLIPSSLYQDPSFTLKRERVHVRDDIIDLCFNHPITNPKEPDEVVLKVFKKKTKLTTSFRVSQDKMLRLQRHFKGVSHFFDRREFAASLASSSREKGKFILADASTLEQGLLRK
ncbi:hypothetical protein DVH24_007886, partial [Malus domestica]